VLKETYPDDFGVLQKKLSFVQQDRIRKILNKSDGSTSHRESRDSPTFSGSASKKSIFLETFKPSTPRIKANIMESPPRVTASQNNLNLRNLPENPDLEDKTFGLFKSQIIQDANDQDWKVFWNFIENKSLGEIHCC
jgi:hypothetical protein